MGGWVGNGRGRAGSGCACFVCVAFSSRLYASGPLGAFGGGGVTIVGVGGQGARRSMVRKEIREIWCAV